MSRLLVISNRVRRPGADAAQGGLAVALGAALRANKGLWFGWSGERTDRFDGALHLHEDDGIRTATVDLEDQDIDEYYNGYANRTLWPLFHYRIDLAEYDRAFGEGYERVNRRLAKTVAPLIEPDDLVWVHDYHLIPLGYDLRRRGIRNRIGFFLHIPWPPTRLLVSLPHHRRLVESLFAYDVVGFQTAEWLESFRHFVEKEMGGTIEGDWVQLGEQRMKAVACPIGIDFADFSAMAAGGTAQAMHDRVCRSLQDRRMLVGVDRLDYSKGLEERFGGWDRVLRDRPEWRREAVLVQIAPPSRSDVATYQAIRAKLDSLAGRINGQWSDVDWTPIRYVNRGYARDELAGIYRAAHVGLVTPLRDGMNLVAKEYVAAQDPERPGVLVLSRFAGAALQMDAALMVNPYSAEELSDAIARALAMPLDERRERHAALVKAVEAQDVEWWQARFLDHLKSVPGRSGAAAAQG